MGGCPKVVVAEWVGGWWRWQGGGGGWRWPCSSPATSVTGGQDGEGGWPVSSHRNATALFFRDPASMFYFMKKAEDCSDKGACPCTVRKREKLAIGVALLHCGLLALNFYFFVDFTLNDGWSRVGSSFEY